MSSNSSEENARAVGWMVHNPLDKEPINARKRDTGQHVHLVKKWQASIAY